MPFWTIESYKDYFSQKRLFCYRSFPQIAQLLEEYSKISNKELSLKIKENNEFEHDFKEGLLEIIQYATDGPGYFAKKLNKHLNNGKIVT